VFIIKAITLRLLVSACFLVLSAQTYECLKLGRAVCRSNVVKFGSVNNSHVLSMTARVVLLLLLIRWSLTAALQDCSGLSTRESLSSQYLIVHGLGGSKASLQACERTNDSTWTEALPIFDCVVGSNGIAALGHKREGDGTTPSGNFSLGALFGWTTATDPAVQQFKTDYRYIADAKDENGLYLDKFVDDVNSTQYNSWVVGPISATSFEQMRISAYKYGLIINYNMYPTVPGTPTSCLVCKPMDCVTSCLCATGLGSAIFMHIWSGPDGSTAGCVALDEANLVSVLQWLDKAKQPRVIIGS
jgi:L,D-peptidoglycan transpeptidase YkuD (ErfK/YbiS/YcfS/YnhG family)